MDRTSEVLLFVLQQSLRLKYLLLHSLRTSDARSTAFCPVPLVLDLSRRLFLIYLFPSSYLELRTFPFSLRVKRTLRVSKGLNFVWHNHMNVSIGRAIHRTIVPLDYPTFSRDRYETRSMPDALVSFSVGIKAQKRIFYFYNATKQSSSGHYGMESDWWPLNQVIYYVSNPSDSFAPHTHPH